MASIMTIPKGSAHRMGLRRQTASLRRSYFSRPTQLADVLDIAAETRCHTSLKYSRSTGSVILAAIRKGIPAVRAAMIASSIPLLGCMRPRNAA